MLRAPLLGPIEDGIEQFGGDGSDQELGEDVTRLTLSRDVVDDKLLIHDPVSQLQEPAREVFASTAVAALPR